MLITLLSQTTSLIIAICLLVFLLALFIVSFVLNKKTPVPKGCEDIMISESKCSMCDNEACKRRTQKEEK